MSMHRYRSHTCGALRESDIGKSVRLSGWCHRVRDHGGVLFILSLIHIWLFSRLRQLARLIGREPVIES